MFREVLQARAAVAAVRWIALDPEIRQWEQVGDFPRGGDYRAWCDEILARVREGLGIPPGLI